MDKHDTFIVEIPGVKPIQLKAYFVKSMIDMGAKSMFGNPRSQTITTCLIRKGNLTLGTGVAIQHPQDDQDNEIAYRTAFKVAAKQAIWGLSANSKMPDNWSVKEFVELWKNLYSGWRKARRIASEKVTA